MKIISKNAHTSKIREWLYRYVPADIISLIVALLLANLLVKTTNNNLLAAVVATWGENIGFFGTILFRDIRESKKNHKINNKKYNHVSVIKNIRNIVIEFSLPEALDSFVIRPFTMFFMINQFGNLQIGIIFGKIAADIIYYIPLVVMYEMRKKHLTDSV